MPASRHLLLACQRAAMAAAATVLMVAANAAPAQQAPESPPAAWRVECSGDGKMLDCRAVQQVFHRESRQLLVSVAVRPAADGKSGAMVMTLPLGLNLTEPVVGQGRQRHSGTAGDPDLHQCGMLRRDDARPTSSLPRCAPAPI